VSYLIDTCTLSELVRPKPARSVVEWFGGVASEALYVSALTLGEIRKGVEKLPPGRRREQIGSWLEVDLPRWFDGRVLPVDGPLADEWGRLVSRHPRVLPVIDALLAATCLRHRLAIVTRNVADFEGTGIVVIDPWGSS
jgi:toxin FitB